MANTPNMGLLLPTVGVTLSPEWASELNTALGLIDSHNHAPGSGSLIGTAGIRVDSDFDFGGFNATGLRTVRISDQTSITLGASDRRAVYSKNGDLYYVNASAAEVQITSGGSIAGATGSISGLTSPASASFSSVTGSFSFLKDSSKPGKLAISDISLYEFNNATAAPITLASPASLANAYTLTLPPAVPTALALYPSVDTSGTMGYSGTLRAVSGTVGFPSVSFADNSATGLYSPSIGILGLSAGGAQVGTASQTGMTIYADAGAVGAPSLAFFGDTNTGFYHVGSDSFAAVAGGTLALLFSGAQLISGYAGTASAPSYSFTSEINSGLYRPSVSVLGMSVVGTLSQSWSASQSLFLAGSQSLPAVGFIGDPDTGIYSTASNQLGITTGGTLRATVNSLGITVGNGGGLTVAGDILGASTIQATGGIYAGSFLTFDGGVSTVKVKTYTGTVGASSSVTLTAPSTIVGFIGTHGAGSSPILQNVNYPGADVYFGQVSLTQINVTNSTGSSRNYRVNITY